MIGRIFQVKKESICLNIYYLRNLHISDTSYDKQAAKGKRSIVHPQYHFDINFTKNHSYKLGLPKSIDENELRNIFLSKDFCRMISLKKNRINRGTKSSRNNNLNF